ncbi:MAG: protein disulfide oxidoreductase [Epsilonproteobacteria bacterium]|nr:protein disulfide oxidoreductase [Campylobacterota bacterium]
MQKKVLGWVKEIAVALILMTLLLNLISFLKKPELPSTILPHFELLSTTGKAISSESYSGKPLIVHIWATWCPTCKLEASTIESLSKKYQVITVAVNSGSDDEINLFMQEHDLTYDVINDTEGRFAQKFAVNSFPTTFIYDSEEEVKFTEVGYTSILGLKFRMWLTK